MRNMSKIVGLLAALLLVAGGIGLAADLPDLVPGTWGEEGVVGKISCGTKWLLLELFIANIGKAQTTHAVKTLVKVDGSVWNVGGNPYTMPAGLLPGYSHTFNMAGPPPGPGMHTLWVKVDSDNAQQELNENNNEATATTSCGKEVPRVQPPKLKLYPKPKIGPPPVEQQKVPQQ